MKYKDYLKDVVIATREAIEAQAGNKFYGYEFACKIMDTVYADFNNTVMTEAEAVEILEGIGIARLCEFYRASKDVYTSVYQIAENPATDEAPINIITNPLKFLSEMTGMVACEIAFYAEGYGNDEKNKWEQEILRKFDADDGGEIADWDIRWIVNRTGIDKLTENCKLVKALA